MYLDRICNNGRLRSLCVSWSVILKNGIGYSLTIPLINLMKITSVRSLLVLHCCLTFIRFDLKLPWNPIELRFCTFRTCALHLAILSVLVAHVSLVQSLHHIYIYNNNNLNNSKIVKSNTENIKSVVHFLHFRFHLPGKYKITVIEITSKSFLPWILKKIFHYV